MERSQAVVEHDSCPPRSCLDEPSGAQPCHFLPLRGDCTFSTSRPCLASVYPHLTHSVRLSSDAVSLSLSNHLAILTDLPFEDASPSSICLPRPPRAALCGLTLLLPLDSKSLGGEEIPMYLTACYILFVSNLPLSWCNSSSLSLIVLI